MTKRAVELTTAFEVSGPWFTKDVKKTVRENIADMLDAAKGAMEQDVRASIAGHRGQMPGYTGWSYNRTIGRRKSGRTGRTWGLWAVVSANTEGGDARVSMLDAKDAIRTKAAAATIEKRWHPYRNAKRAARRAIASLDLAKGLN